MALLLWPVAINIENVGPDLSAFMSSEIRQFSSPSVAIQNQAVQVVGVSNKLAGAQAAIDVLRWPAIQRWWPTSVEVHHPSEGETTTDSCWLVWIVRGLNESTNHWSGAVEAVWTYTQSIQQIRLSESETWHNKKWLVLELRCRRNQYLGYTNKRQNPQNSMFDHAKGHPLGTPTCPEWSPAGYHTSCCQGARRVENVCAGQQEGDTTNPTQIKWDVNSLLRTSCDMNNMILICEPNVCCANWCTTWYLPTIV